MAEPASLSEKIIPLAATMKECMDALIDDYTILPSILADEEQAISSKSIESFQSSGEKKEAVAQSTQKIFDQLSQVSLQLKDLYENVFEKPFEGGLQLEDCCEIFEEFSKRENLNTLEKQILLRLTEELKDKQSRFDRLISDLKPQIEKNRTIIKTMLDHYHQSYRFWVEVVDEQSANYTASGVKDTSKQHSSFQIKA